MTEKIILEVKDICKSYLNKKVLDDYNLEVKEGEIIALLGPSGCGKTTLLRCICGFERCDSGNIFLLGECSTNTPPERRNVGMVFQSNTLFPHKNVQENLLMGLDKVKYAIAKNSRIELTRKMLAEIGLEGFSTRDVASLSGGEARRVELARTLLSEPKIVLLDEPFSALNKELKEKLIRDTRRLLKNKNITAILVTHDIEEAELFSDRIIQMSS